MSNRIQQLFNSRDKNILSVYITAGYPQLNDTVSIIRELDGAGVDIIEIGFPFSDPLADGPVIQQSSHTSIANGMTLNLLFEQLQDIRSVTKMPLLLMGYLNPILQFGEEKFIRKCAEIGIDGIIVPDMPLSYYKENLEHICNELDIANILLITPQTNNERISEIDAASTGFIYVVSTNSITGVKNNVMHLDYYNRIMEMNLKNPTVTGFGIHDKKSFETACKYNNGAIIGSAFINYITKFGIAENKIGKFIRSIRE